MQTVSRPYYTVGRKVFVETNCYQTVFVVNPGPWKKRDPEIEFPVGAGVFVIDFSRGVSVVQKENKLTAFMDSGLSPGCNFFITYKFSPNPTMDSSPGIVCDGKVCKESPVVDLDIILWILIVLGVLTSVVAVLSTWECIDTKRELKKERTSNINIALSALIDRCNAQADVSDSIHTLVSFMAGKGTDIRARPLKKDTGNGKVKPSKEGA